MGDETRVNVTQVVLSLPMAISLVTVVLGGLVWLLSQMYAIRADVSAVRLEVAQERVSSEDFGDLVERVRVLERTVAALRGERQ